MFDEIRPEGSTVSSEQKKAYNRERMARKAAEKKAMKLATGEKLPRQSHTGGILDPANRHTAGRPKSIINKVTEYGATFNKLNEEAMANGFGPLTSAMETLIMAMNSDELDIKEKARIADKLAAFESSRAPIISIEHIQNVNKDEDVSAEGAMDDFLDSLRKV
jgi:hypothetical protein